MHEALHNFHPAIGTWFESQLGLPTPPQILGWPPIVAGQSTLILAPTGSGKTLAAFLAAIDSLAKSLLAVEEDGDDEGLEATLDGVQILYISPLKSLANDVLKNLIRPLAQIADTAAEMQMAWPEITVGLRTGDTPQKDRTAMLRSPPHILVTTPESLNLLLTSAGRRTLQSVRYVIVDEVHAMAGGKRGTFLSLLLERLEQQRREREAVRGKRKIAPGMYLPVEPLLPLIRIGLSATARPEETIATWLGGYEASADAGALNGLKPRAVTIVRAGQRKRLDLAVECPFGPSDDEAQPENLPRSARGLSHWPEVTARVLQLIREHRSTLIFANSRRLVERLAATIQEQPDVPPLLPHHGSISKNVRLETEEALKKGELAAVATSSLELGIDVGALDLVCQIDSPGNVAAALQRVGRAGHLEKATAKGRLIARTLSELPSFAALIPLMYEGFVEDTQVPQNCLDVLAQQIVAACAVRPWRREELYQLFRCSASFCNLPIKQFDSVVAMLSKRAERTTASGLKPKISFDRVNDTLIALPGTAKLALMNGGVIADTGQFAVYIADKMIRIGELDEEFVFETKEGDRIILGSQTWRVVSIDVDRLLVSPAEPGTSRMPFWRGELAPRSELLGQHVARFNAVLEARTAQGWEIAREFLTQTHHFTEQAADALIQHYARQMAFSAIPTDTRVVVEHFHDRAGEPIIAILCPLGSRVNYALRLALEARFADKRLPAQIIHHDDGLLIRPPVEVGQIPENPLAWLNADSFEQLIVDQLENTALFGLRFRQNAARALMLPRMNMTQRTPLWQQRLRARHLLALIKQQRNFPIVVETYRECLQDTLLVDRARRILADIETGKTTVTIIRNDQPSPLAHNLFSNFQQEFLYAQDDPLTSTPDAPTVDSAILDQILQRRVDDAAPSPPAFTQEDITTLLRRITGSEYPARTPEELLEKIEAAGPVPLGSPADPLWVDWVVENPADMLQILQSTHRLVVIDWPGEPPSTRWVATESLAPLLRALPTRPNLYHYLGNTLTPQSWSTIPSAFLHADLSVEDAQQRLIESAIKRVPLTTIAELQLQLPFLTDIIPSTVAHLLRSGMIAKAGGGDQPDQIAFVEYLDQLRSIALRRQRRSTATADLATLQRHLLSWHHITAPTAGPDSLEDTLDLLAGTRLPLITWEHDVLPLRISRFLPPMLDAACSASHWVPVGYLGDTVAFIPRHQLPMRPVPDPHTLSAPANEIIDFLRQNGASFLFDIESATHSENLPHLLKELFYANLISNDHLDSLRATLRIAATTKPVSHLTTSARYPSHLGSNSRRPARLKQQWWKPNPSSLGGRWYLLPPLPASAAYSPQSLGPPASAGPLDSPLLSSALDIAEHAADRVDRLLRRHGFACRELLDPPLDGTWRQCYDVLTRMEWAGTVRRGYFVDGITGSQFTLPNTHLPAANGSSPAVTWLSLLDPANLYPRLATKWLTNEGEAARIPRVPGSYLALVDGHPVLAAVSWATRLIPLPADAHQQNLALAALPDLLPRLPRDITSVLTIKHWLDEDIIGSPAEEILHTAGFVRDTQGLKLYRSYAPAPSTPGPQ